MSDLLRRLNWTINKYYDKNGKSPESVSMSHEFSDDINKIPQAYIRYTNNFTPSLMGCRIKFVKRKNYMEAMPRRKKLRYSKTYLADKVYWGREVLFDRDRAFFTPIEISSAKNMGLVMTSA
jgi:hypothetical protein